MSLRPLLTINGVNASSRSSNGVGAAGSAGHRLRGGVIRRARLALRAQPGEQVVDVVGGDVVVVDLVLVAGGTVADLDVTGVVVADLVGRLGLRLEIVLGLRPGRDDDGVGPPVGELQDRGSGESVAGGAASDSTPTAGASGSAGASLDVAAVPGPVSKRASIAAVASDEPLGSSAGSSGSLDARAARTSSLIEEISPRRDAGTITGTGPVVGDRLTYSLSSPSGASSATTSAATRRARSNACTSRSRPWTSWSICWRARSRRRDNSLSTRSR